MARNKPDMISSLSDQILCHILSFLPTKYSVRTDVLSPRWRRLYTQVPVLDFNNCPQEADSKGGHNKAAANKLFISFVTKVLLRYQVANMHKFNLDCSSECRDYVHSWICAAIYRKVCKMSVRADVGPYKHIRLPCHLSMSKTLVELELDGKFILPFDGSVTFLPNLKTLHLRGVTICTDESKQLSFSTCPVLEDLCLERCYSKWTINISVSSLKILKLWQNEMTSVVLNLPSLEILEYFNYGQPYEISGNVMQSLYQALINSWTCLQGSDGIQKLIKMAHNLYLYGPSVEASVSWLPFRISIFPCPCFFFSLPMICFYVYIYIYIYIYILKKVLSSSELPKFQKLTRLELESAYVAWWKSLPNLLERSPNLEVLILQAGWLRYGEADVDMNLVLPIHDECTCLSMHLKELKIKRFSGADYEFKLVEYFLNNSKVLKKLIIHTNKPLESQYITCLNRLALSRHSKDCQVVVINT